MDSFGLVVANLGHGKILGGDMIAETIHLHPALGESIGMAAEIAHGSCTDVALAWK